MVCSLFPDRLRGVGGSDIPGERALHRAAIRGHLPATEALLDLGADPLAADGHGATALHRAAVLGHVGRDMIGPSTYALVGSLIASSGALNLGAVCIIHTHAQ